MNKGHSKQFGKRKHGLEVPNPRTHLQVGEIVVEPIIPEMHTVDDVTELCRNVPQFASLPINHLRILIEISTDIITEESRSDLEIAETVGCDPSTVYRARNNPRFSVCLGVLVVGLTRGRADHYLRWTEAAAQDGKVGALKLLWELTGLWIKTSRSLNVNVQAELQQAPQTFEEAYIQFLTALGTAGYTAERITSDFNDLRSRGAFG